MRIMRELRADLAGFLGGRELGICVLRGEREHLPFVYRLLQEIEGASTDVFLSFPHAFESTESYVELIVGRIEASGREARGDPRWALPGGGRAPGRAAAERLKDALACARAMLPRGGETPRLVVVLCPLAVTDEDGYRSLVNELALQDAGAPPWFRRMRLLVHVPGSQELRLPRFVCALPVDLSHAALAASAARDAEDPSLSREQRAQALLQSAMLELAHRRFEPARARLDALYGEARALKSPVLAALALSGLGDVERVVGADEAAIGWYERALVPASETGAALLMLVVTQNLARVYFELGRHADAETFFDGAQRLAMAVPDAGSHAQALQWRGRLEELRGAGEAAGASYLAAARVAREYQHHELTRELTPRLSDIRRRVSPELSREIARFLGGAR